MTPIPGRSRGLDLFKTMLVMGMVTAHVLQLLSRQMPGWTERFSEFINLVTFSGFLFAMGIGLGLSRGGDKPLWQRLRPVLMLLGAAWLSALAFALLVDRLPLTTALLLDIVSFRRLFGWSEFLATFFMLYALIAVARPVLIGIATNPYWLLVATVLCFGSTWLVMDQGWPLTATLIGTTRFASFPLLPYLPWFLVGVALGRVGGRLSLWHWLAAVSATGWLVFALAQTGQWPGRFPPTILWIVGSALPILAYWFVASVVADRVSLPGWATLPGQHVLSYLLVSNLAIFAARNLWGRPVLDVWTWLAVAAVLLAAIGGAWALRIRAPLAAGE